MIRYGEKILQGMPSPSEQMVYDRLLKDHIDCWKTKIDHLFLSYRTVASETRPACYRKLTTLLVMLVVSLWDAERVPMVFPPCTTAIFWNMRKSKQSEVFTSAVVLFRVFNILSFILNQQ